MKYGFSQANPEIPYENTSVTFSVLSLFDVLNPAIQIGNEFELNENNILRVESGVIIKHSILGMMGFYSFPNRKLFSYSGYKIRTELQHVLRTRGNKCTRKDFVSGELYFTHNRAEVNDDYYDYQADIYNDEFQFIRNKLGVNFKVGKKIYTHHFLFEFSGGMGVAYLNNFQYQRDNPHDKATDSLYEFILRDGKFLRLNTPFTIRLGYRF